MKYYLEQCLFSLGRALDGIKAEVIVVDNHSSDGSSDYIKSRFPQVVYIQSTHNVGFARANNIGIKRSSGEYVLLLNPDTIVGEHTVKEVLNFMDSHQKAGASGVCMFKADGSKAMESRRGVPTPMTAFYKMTGLCRRFHSSHVFAHYYMSYLPWNTPQRIEIVSGAFCMLRRKALDSVGLLDEDFFMYGEDIDLSYRLLKSGWQNWFLPQCILHYKGESTRKSGFRYVHVFYSAMLIFFRKHYAGASVFICIPVKIAIFAKAVMALAVNLLSSAYKSLGFYGKFKIKPVRFVFVGSSKMQDKCRDIATAKNLDARYVDVIPERISSVCDDSFAGMMYVVFDACTLSFEEMLNLFSFNSRVNVSLATFVEDKIITSEGIII